VDERVVGLVGDVLGEPLAHRPDVRDLTVVLGHREEPLLELLPEDLDLPFQVARRVAELALVESDGLVIDGVDLRERVDQSLADCSPRVGGGEPLGFGRPEDVPVEPLQQDELRADQFGVVAGRRDRRHRHLAGDRIHHPCFPEHVVGPLVVGSGRWPAEDEFVVPPVHEQGLVREPVAVVGDRQLRSGTAAEFLPTELGQRGLVDEFGRLGHAHRCRPRHKTVRSPPPRAPGPRGGA
jgi:hypothetical protein